MPQNVSEGVEEDVIDEELSNDGDDWVMFILVTLFLLIMKSILLLSHFSSSFMVWLVPIKLN